MSYPHSPAPSAPSIGPLAWADGDTHIGPASLCKRRAGPMCVSALGAVGVQEENPGRCFQEKAERLRQLLSIPGIRLASSMEGAKHD
jgi:hypothetical protein